MQHLEEEDEDNDDDYFDEKTCWDAWSWYFCKSWSIKNKKGPLYECLLLSIFCCQSICTCFRNLPQKIYWCKNIRMASPWNSAHIVKRMLSFAARSKALLIKSNFHRDPHLRGEGATQSRDGRLALLSLL